MTKENPAFDTTAFFLNSINACADYIRDDTNKIRTRDQDYLDEIYDLADGINYYVDVLKERLGITQ